MTETEDYRDIDRRKLERMRRNGDPLERLKALERHVPDLLVIEAYVLAGLEDAASERISQYRRSSVVRVMKNSLYVNLDN